MEPGTGTLSVVRCFSVRASRPCWVTTPPLLRPSTRSCAMFIRMTCGACTSASSTILRMKMRHLRAICASVIRMENTAGCRPVVSWSNATRRVGPAAWLAPSATLARCATLKPPCNNNWPRPSGSISSSKVHRSSLYSRKSSPQLVSSQQVLRTR
ncbi:hypothetical protein SDC9_177626 [bioreactor metagenome]|uniref:Uncharacterized protein n=1 Tax=bioreactor metagenome TaxID=1076179 RepID=A0A645GTK0_9ZZZZ